MSTAAVNTPQGNPANIQTADFARHGKLKLKPHPAFPHANDRNLVALNVSELGRSCGNFPIVLVRNPNDQRLVLMAMLGLRNGENCYAGEQFWESTYVPMAVQRHPFIVGLDDRSTEKSQLATCLEIDSALLGESEGLPLFNADGTESEVLRNASQLLRNMFEAGKFTEQFVEKLEELNLVAPFNIDLQAPRGEINRISGLYTLDENRLKALGAEQLLDLQKRDYLAPCHLMLVSLYQLNRLIQLRNRKGGEQIVNFRLDFPNAAQAAAKA